MKNATILEMLNNGEIEELKALLTEEIYKDSLKADNNAKTRYAAMKRFFKFVTSPIESCTKPCKDVLVHGKSYNSFCDSLCFALTNESVDTLECFDKSKADYLNIERLVNFNNAQCVEEIDLNKALAEIKSKGYKFSKSEYATKDFHYAIKYRDSYYNALLIDKAYNIINDGKSAKVYYFSKLAPMLIETSVGIAGVCPFKADDDVEEKKIIVYVED